MRHVIGPVTLDCHPSELPFLDPESAPRLRDLALPSLPDMGIANNGMHAFESHDHIYALLPPTGGQLRGVPDIKANVMSCVTSYRLRYGARWQPALQG
jgi:hypothetical protein